MPIEPRIVTLTMNPAIDLACMAPAVRPTHKIRAFDERLDAGGGGINVSRVVRILGGDTLALVMTAVRPRRCWRRCWMRPRCHGNASRSPAAAASA